MLTQQQIDYLLSLVNNFEDACREHTMNDSEFEEEIDETQEAYSDARTALVEAIQQLKEPIQ